MITDKMAMMKSAECMESLMPKTREMVGQWYEAMLSRGVTPYIYYGYRSDELQQKLYDLYKSGKGPLAAAPGRSYHNAAAAIDWVPLKPMDDMPGWQEADWDNETAYKIGEAVGLECGLHHIIQESGHLQDGRFLTVQEAKRAFEQSGWPTA